MKILPVFLPIYSHFWASPLVLVLFHGESFFSKKAPETPSALDLFIKPSRSYASTLRTSFANFDNEKMPANEDAGNSY